MPTLLFRTSLWFAFLYGLLTMEATGFAAEPEPVHISGSLSKPFTHVLLCSPTMSVPMPFAQSDAGAAGSFELQATIPQPMVQELVFFDGRKRIATLPIYLEPAAKLAVEVASGKVEHTGDLALENSIVLKQMPLLRMELILKNQSGDSERAASFLAHLQEDLKVGADEEATPEAFRQLILEIAQRGLAYNRLKALEAEGGAPYLQQLQAIYANPPRSGAFAGQIEWQYQYLALTAAFAEAGLFADADHLETARVTWGSDAWMQSKFVVFLLDHEMNMRRWFRTPWRPRLLPLERFVSGERDRANWERIVKEFEELEASYATIAVGQPAAEFAFEDVNGKLVSLTDLRGKFVLLDFWNMACGPCIKQFPYLHKAEEELADSGIVIVSMNCDYDDAHETWREFVKERGLGGVLLRVNDAKSRQFFADYQLKGFPRFALIDPAGKMADPYFLRPEDKKFVPELLSIRKQYDQEKSPTP
ncbi:TlpA family protein disulfide reductase [Blastopirellula sp. JC732]|uniref:TlpA family protein disulfide reductase n=1 Tax=Blastopirellula sediminis TaxID=2894196 RepID=A0A9X1MHT2_9BACT|nr:TlpA disulfide reductase family protein [Blastopirellula sediminis]MCC9608186.1 TlpA family protein disulfide reductase [Blastopirellula sediminis]MCC9627021.1 TlpA family protein disulfide reductase [Blastopirellula sediminis]